VEIEEGTLRLVIREEMKSVLKEIGLHDDHAGNDVRDLRSLITDWRELKKAVWQTVARWGTMIVLGLLTFGAWMKLSGSDSGDAP
jgi:hypothetical protein